MSNTTYLGLNKPAKGSENWGTPLNNNFDSLDDYLTKPLGYSLTSGVYWSDLFYTDTLNESWSTYNAVDLTITPRDINGVTIKYNADGTHFGGIYIAAPTNPYMVTAKVSYFPMVDLAATDPGGKNVGGIALIQDLGAFAEIYVIGRDGRWSDGAMVGMNTDPGTNVSQEAYRYGAVNNYYRFIMNGANWSYLTSPDGFCWGSINQESTGSFSPGAWAEDYFGYIGLGILSPTVGTIGEMSLHCEWFIVEEL